MLAIIITAYNRAQPLNNLLNNLLQIRTSIKLPLIISIDNSGTLEVNKIAESFVWPLGEKKVIIHQQKLGLVKHFIWVGDQTEKFEHVLFLEDDLLVSPEVINYVLQLIEYYENDDLVAAASLYNPVLVEATGTKFYQLQDEYDAYFLQHPYWGNVWFKNKWREFKRYLETYEENKNILPSHIAEWDRSFKKKYIQFLIETNRTIITPKNSLVTNNGCSGIHSGDMFMYQSNLSLEPKKYNFPTVHSSKSMYDAFEEIYPDILKYYNKDLREYDFCVDLLGTRKYFPKEYVLTTRRSKNPIKMYSSLMKPTELSVIMNFKGDGKVLLTKHSDIIFEKSFDRKRRFRDIQKNYYVGVYASFYMFLNFFKLLLSRILK